MKSNQNTGVIVKRLLIVSLVFLGLSLSAQRWENVSLAAEIGFPIGTETENLSLLANVEPKLKLSEHLTMGIRIACVINSQSFETQDARYSFRTFENDHGFLSTVPTLDYTWELKNFKPFFGVGAGPYLLANYVDVSERISFGLDFDSYELKVDYQVGVLVRGGVEMGKTRLSAEYNFIPKSHVESPSGDKFGTITSSYLGVSFGYVFGKAS